MAKAVQGQIGIDPTLTKCQASARADSNVACTVSGLFERTQCSVLNSLMQIHICRCVDEESGEDIPLTEKPVVGEAKMDCGKVTEQQVEPLAADYDEPDENIIPRLYKPSQVYSMSSIRPCEKEVAMGVGGFSPACSGAGKFRHMQCMQNSCFCVDPQTGVEVEGSRGPFPSCDSKTEEPEPVAAKNCLRIKEEALVFNKKVSDSGPFASSFADLKFVPSCNGDGSYKALQCDEKAKSCWCADRMGVEVSNTRKATGGVFKSAPPDCSAQARVVKEFASQTPCERIKARGLHQNLVCDRKGYFEKVQIRVDENGNEIKYCADPETGYPRENYNYNLATRECLYRPPQNTGGPTRSPADFMAMLGIENDSSFATVPQASPTDNLRQQLLAKYGLDNSAAAVSGLSSSGGSTQDMIRKMVMEKVMGANASSAGSGSSLSTLAQQMLGQAGSSSGSGANTLQQMLAQKIIANQGQQSAQPTSTEMIGGMSADNVQGIYRKLLMNKLQGQNSAEPTDLANQVAQYSAQAGTSGLLSNPLYQQLLNKDVRLSQLAQAFNPSQTGSSVADLLSPQQNEKAQQMLQLISQLG